MARRVICSAAARPGAGVVAFQVPITFVIGGTTLQVTTAENVARAHRDGYAWQNWFSNQDRDAPATWRSLIDMCVDGTMTSRPVAYERVLKSGIRAPPPARYSDFAHKARPASGSPSKRRRDERVIPWRNSARTPIGMAIERSPEFQELDEEQAGVCRPGDDLLPGLVLRFHHPVPATRPTSWAASSSPTG